MLESQIQQVEDGSSHHIRLSVLPHTWLIDIDGTALRHNGHLMADDESNPSSAAEQILPGVYDFWLRIPPQDIIILMSARKHEEKNKTIEIFNSLGLRFDHAIFDLPTGERILINDSKPLGLKTAVAVNVSRDEGLNRISFHVDEDL